MQKLALVINDIRSTYNVGSMLRSAECFGVSHVYFSGYTPYPAYANDVRLPHLANKVDRQIAKTALGAERLVPFSVHVSLEYALAEARQDGYWLAALEQDTASVAIETYDFSQATALVVGNEIVGVDAWTKQHCNVILEIRQFGHKESLNVASATAIALYAARTTHTV